MNSTQDSTATQKSLFARYQEHITSAIFIGLVLGIPDRAFPGKPL